MDQAQAFLNGQFVPASAASVSLVDAGFVLGVTVTEQLRTFHGDLFRLEAHLDRLRRSLEIVEVDPGISLGELADAARELCARNHCLLEPGDDLGLSIFVTPGPYPLYAGMNAPRRPTVCLHTYPLPFGLWAGKYRSGQSLRVTDIRQVGPEHWPAALKCRSRMHYYLADRRAAAAEPGSRALLLDREGYVTEASTANLLIYREGEGLISPPYERILHGISLDVALALGRTMGIATACRELRVEDVAAADEVLLTSTPLCVLPVTRFDGRPVAGGSPGPIFGRLLRAWGESVGVDLAAQVERFACR